MNPGPLDGTDQRARTVLAAGVEPDGLPARWRGGTAVGRGNGGASAMAATPPVLVAEARCPPLP